MKLKSAKLGGGLRLRSSSHIWVRTKPIGPTQWWRVKDRLMHSEPWPSTFHAVELVLDAAIGQMWADAEEDA